ncbi:hypothetical protein EDD15DRAFT_2258659, partial [Pisolithus albus]
RDLFFLTLQYCIHEYEYDWVSVTGNYVERKKSRCYRQVYRPPIVTIANHQMFPELKCQLNMCVPHFAAVMSKVLASFSDKELGDEFSNGNKVTTYEEHAIARVRCSQNRCIFQKPSPAPEGTRKSVKEVTDHSHAAFREMDAVLGIHLATAR